MTVEKREAGIIGNEVDLALLVTAKHNNVFHAGGFRSREVGQFKAVTV
jgi:hypothetical protein